MVRSSTASTDFCAGRAQLAPVENVPQEMSNAPIHRDKKFKVLMSFAELCRPHEGGPLKSSLTRALSCSRLSKPPINAASPDRVPYLRQSLIDSRANHLLHWLGLSRGAETMSSRAHSESVSGASSERGTPFEPRELQKLQTPSRKQQRAAVVRRNRSGN